MADSTEQARAEPPPRVRDHLKAAGSAAADAARTRARGARDWARGRFEDLQDRVESRPQSAAMWALGIGVIAGVLLGTLITRSGRD